MSRWEPIRLRNALTESWNDGHSVSSIMQEHGLDERSVVDHLDAARSGFNSYRDWDEQGRPPQKRSKPLDTPVKVIPHPTAKDRLGDRTDPLEETLVPYERSPETQEAYETLMYGLGFYRVPCSVCGLGIKRTGKRGRALTQHPECKIRLGSDDDLFD